VAGKICTYVQGLSTGRKLRIIRILLGFGLGELAYKAGISTASLSRMETGVQQISTGHLERLCAEMGVTVAEFYAWGTQDAAA
jgi:transcriptional regulator with XRE-family HTH domain